MLSKLIRTSLFLSASFNVESYDTKLFHHWQPPSLRAIWSVKCSIMRKIQFGQSWTSIGKSLGIWFKMPIFIQILFSRSDVFSFPSALFDSLSSARFQKVIPVSPFAGSSARVFWSSVQLYRVNELWRLSSHHQPWFFFCFVWVSFGTNSSTTLVSSVVVLS